MCSVVILRFFNRLVCYSFIFITLFVTDYAVLNYLQESDMRGKCVVVVVSSYWHNTLLWQLYEIYNLILLVNEAIKMYTI